MPSSRSDLMIRAGNSFASDELPAWREQEIGSHQQLVALTQATGSLECASAVMFMMLMAGVVT